VQAAIIVQSPLDFSLLIEGKPRSFARTRRNDRIRSAKYGALSVHHRPRSELGES
jgi:hypothetical protein